MRNGSKIAIVGAAALSAALVPATAQATPGSGVTGKIIYQKTVGHTDYTLREVTIQPGGTTGWHHHDGSLYAFDKAGTLTHSDADCVTTDIYHAGQFFTEPAGVTNVHIGLNLGKDPVVLEVLYVLPAGSPLAEDDTDPGCGFH